MSKMLIEDPVERACAQHEEDMYFRIMQDGKLDEQGFLAEPPADMTAEEQAYYKRLLRTCDGRIPYIV